MCKQVRSETAAVLTCSMQRESVCELETICNRPQRSGGDGVRSLLIAVRETRVEQPRGKAAAAEWAFKAGPQNRDAKHDRIAT